MGSEESMGIYEKLADAISDVERIGRDGKNQHFKYTYTSAEQVYRVIRGPLLDHGLVVIPEATDYNTAGDLGTVKLRLRIVDTDTGESIEAQWYGEGQDKGDKAVYKAITGGMKTWLKHLFLLPADDDPEADPATDRAPAKADPMNKLRELIGDSGLTKEQMAAVGKWVKPNGTVQQDRLTKAVQMLEGGKAGQLAEVAGA
jgi:hypothetical protein